MSVEVGPPKPYEAIFDRIEAGSRAEYRRSVGRTDDSEYRPSLAGSRELLPADDHVVDDFMVDDDELGMANNQAAQQNRLWAPIGMNRNETRDDHDGWERGTG